MDRILMFLLFFVVVFGLFGLFQWRLIRAFRRWLRSAVDPSKHATWYRVSTVLLMVFNVTLVLRFFLGELGSYDHPLSQALIVYPSGIFFAAVVLGFFLVSIVDVGRLIARATRLPLRASGGQRDGAALQIDQKPEFDQSRRRFLRLSGTSAIAAIGATPVFSAVATARDYQLNRIPLAFPELPSELEGFSIAHISDIHSGVFMTEENMREIFELTNSLFPNLTVITGDLVDNADAQIPALHRALPMLKSDLGVYACLGNHDHYATADKVVAAAQDRNVIMLNNEHRIIRVDGAPLSIIGIDDAGKGARNFANLDQAMNGVNPDALKVLLSHRPDIFPSVRARGIDLMLSGHTHGGQVGLEIMGLNLNPVYLVHRYARGLYREDGKYNYVNVGVGMVGVPIRLVRPEIALLTLTRGNGNAGAGYHPA